MASKVLLLFFMGFVVCADAGKMLGSSPCTFGPAYWCKDYGKAVECHAVKHCRENVWKLKRSNIDHCTLCKLAIKSVKSVLDEKTVQQKFLDFLKDVCDNAGLGPLTEECKEIVSQYEPDIIKNLDIILADPDKVCIKIGMCQAQDQQVMIAPLIRRANPRLQPFDGIPLTDTQKCLMCRLLKKDLDKIPHNRTKITEVFVKNACSDKKCQRTMTKLVPVIVGLMRMKVDLFCVSYNTESCKVEPKVVRKDLMSPNKLKDMGCDFCVYFMSEAEDMLKKNNLTEKEFEKMVQLFCEQLKFMASKCKQMIDQFLPLIYEMLLELKPYQVCQEIMMCPTAAASELENDPRCILGASFWCASLKNAKRCSALQYCKSHVWHVQNQ